MSIFSAIGKGIKNAATWVGNKVGGLIPNTKPYEKRQLAMQQKLQDMQIQGSKEMTNYQQQKELEMWNKTNYPNQIEMMKKAGLNPALLYGTGGGGGTSVGGAGHTVDGGKFNPDTAINPLMGAMGMGLQRQLQKAQIKLMGAEATKTEAEATKISGVDTKESESRITNLQKANEQMDASIDNIRQETQNKEVQRAGFKLQNAFDEIRNEIQEATEFNEINRLKWLSKTAKYQLDIIKTDKEIKQATKDQVIRSMELNVMSLVKDLLLKDKSLQMSDAQMNKMIQDVANNVRGLDIQEAANYIKDKYPTVQQTSGRVLNWFANWMQQIGAKDKGFLKELQKDDK